MKWKKPLDIRTKGRRGRKDRHTEGNWDRERRREKWGGINCQYQEWHSLGSCKQQHRALQWLNGNWFESLSKFRDEVAVTRKAEFTKTIKTEHPNGVRSGKETGFLRQAFPKRQTDMWWALPASPTVGSACDVHCRLPIPLRVWEDSKPKFTEGCFPH